MSLKNGQVGSASFFKATVSFSDGTMVSDLSSNPNEARSWMVAKDFLKFSSSQPDVIEFDDDGKLTILSNSANDAPVNLVSESSVDKTVKDTATVRANSAPACRGGTCGVKRKALRS